MFARFRYNDLKEAGRDCGGRGVLWQFNRFLPEKPCQTGTLLKTLLLTLIDVEALSHPSASSYGRQHPFFKRAVRRLCLYTRQRPPQNGFVLTGKPSPIREIDFKILSET